MSEPPQVVEEKKDDGKKAEEAKKDKRFEFDRPRHIRFLMHCLNVLPSPYLTHILQSLRQLGLLLTYQSQESAKLTIIYFVVGSLDVLGEIDKVDKASIINYIYSLQLVPDGKNPEARADACGFRGSPYIGNPFTTTGCSHVVPYDASHIAMTYVGLAVLKMLGDDYSRVNRPAILGALRKLQQPDGSFAAVAGGAESDVRFVYCACAISAFLNDWSGFNVEKAMQYILLSQTYEGAFAQGPLQECHGGSTYCALAALTLAGKAAQITRKDDMMKWLLDRQVSGFQGRCNKVADTCYSFWIGASLTLLGQYSLVNTPIIRGFSMTCQHAIGGFSKWPDMMPDVLHTYFSLCGLSLMGEPNLLPLDPALGVTIRALGRTQD